MVMTNNHNYRELETLTQKIELNEANLNDYKRYEELLVNGGLSRDYIFSYLRRAGFNTWEEFVHARKTKENERKERNESLAVAAIVGVGIAMLISAFQKD